MLYMFTIQVMFFSNSEDLDTATLEIPVDGSIGWSGQLSMLPCLCFSMVDSSVKMVD
jgi:hypothetical protein